MRWLCFLSIDTPNIVLMVGICSIPPKLCIVMEYMSEGSLYDLLFKKKRELSAEERKWTVKQIVSVLHYLHLQGIVHRDIKSHNFLIDKYLNVKLCDFGLARAKDDLNKGTMQFSGTPVYMSQELFLKKGYTSSIDIFALGTLIYEIYARDIPYNGLDPADIKEKVLKDHCLPSRNSIPKSILNLGKYEETQSINAVSLKSQRDPRCRSCLPFNNGDSLEDSKHR